jgi:ABC-type uncharacterized transport system permease subunit
MKLRYFLPLAAHVVPTIVIGFGSVIPGSCIEGVNTLTIGFVASVVGTCVAYTAGVWTAARDRPRML